MWLTMIGLGKMGGNRVRRLRRDGTESTTGNAFGGHTVKPSGDQK